MVSTVAIGAPRSDYWCKIIRTVMQKDCDRTISIRNQHRFWQFRSRASVFAAANVWRKGGSQFKTFTRKRAFSTLSRARRNSAKRSR